VPRRMLRFFRKIGCFFFFLCIIVDVCPAEEIKLVTINVWSGLDYIGNIKMGEYEDSATRENRYRLLIKNLRDIAPDVVALNEANKLPEYARRIARDLGCDVLYHVGIGGIRVGMVGLPLNLREGDVLLARKHCELESSGRKQLSGGPVGNILTLHTTDATQVIGGRIRVSGRYIYVFNTHWHASEFAQQESLGELVEKYTTGRLESNSFLDSISDAVEGSQWRLNEARKTLEFIDKVAGDAPVILMGDFNALHFSEEIETIKAAGFIDTYAALNTKPGYTWDELLNTNITRHYHNEKNDGLKRRRDRIDYIFVRGNELVPLRSRVVFNTARDGLHPSDHFGVFSVVAVSE